MPMSTYLANEILDHVLRSEAYTDPTSVFVSLHTTSPGNDGAGAECSGGSYAREELTAGFDAGASKATENTAAIEFTAATGSWGTVTHVGIWDALSGGNLLFYGTLDASKAVENGDTFTIAAGALDLAVT